MGDTADSNDAMKRNNSAPPPSRASPASPFAPDAPRAAGVVVDKPLAPTASGTGPVSEVDPPTTSDDNGAAVDIPELQRRLAAAEAEAVRHVAIISSMHSWAAQTTTSLRQVQEKCETAETRAQVAEKQVETLRHQLTQVAAQVEAITVAVAPMHAAASHGGENGGKKRRRGGKAGAPGLPRVGTLTSLAPDPEAGTA